MKQLVGGETCRRAPLRLHGQHCPVHHAYPILGTLLFHQDSQVLFHHTVFSFAERMRRVSIGHTWGYLNIEALQRSLYHPPSLRMRTSSSECTCLSAP